MPGPMDINGMAPKQQPMAKPAETQRANTSRANKLEQACRDFESLFLQHVMQQMRQTVPTDGLFNGGRGEQIYTSMLDSEMAKSISNQRSLGLAPVLYQQLTSLSETSQKNDD